MLQIEEREELIQSYQNILSRQITKAYEAKQMDADTYARFAAMTCEEETMQGIFDHYAAAFAELTEYHRGRLHQRMLNGAELLDGMRKDDPRYPKYIKAYDALAEEYTASLKREV